MKLHAYLSRSRHGIFYFRWPLPTSGRNTTRSTVRLSLGTRCPEEAGMLARHLASCGFALKRQPQEARMDHATLRAAVTDYFRTQLHEAKARRAFLGPYTPEEREEAGNTINLLKADNGDYWRLLGRDHAK